tara:strand:- start:135 stop:356 length:222 start_codon:yes stop_codon:yes gene_type:complete
METDPTAGILSSFDKLQVPSEKPMKPKGNGMMNKQGNFRKTTQRDEQPAIKAKRIQMYIASKNPKRGGMNESV